MSSTRTRHMVDISDYAWDKLEKLAARVDAATYLYKGRPRYGKLIELAIEKLEDSTMEWTVEEVELAQEEVPDEWYGDTQEGEETVEWDSKKGWWKGDKLDKYKPSQAAQDMALYGNTYTGVDYGTGGDTTVTLKPIKVKDIQFKVSAHDTATEQLSKIIETLKDLNKSAGAPALTVDEYIAVGKKMEDALLDGITSAIAGKPKPSYVKVFVNQPGYIELTTTLSQALSAPQQLALRKFAEAAFAECSSDDGAGALLVSMKNIPWNKLWLSVTYSDPSALVKSLEDVASTVSSKVEAWLLQGNFIGPLPQAVDITDKKVTYKTFHGQEISLTAKISAIPSEYEKNNVVSFVKGNASVYVDGPPDVKLHSAFPNMLIRVIWPHAKTQESLELIAKKLRDALEIYLLQNIL